MSDAAMSGAGADPQTLPADNEALFILQRQVQAAGLLDRQPGYYTLKVVLTLLLTASGWAIMVASQASPARAGGHPACRQSGRRPRGCGRDPPAIQGDPIRARPPRGFRVLPGLGFCPQPQRHAPAARRPGVGLADQADDDDPQPAYVAPDPLSLWRDRTSHRAPSLPDHGRQPAAPGPAPSH
jgi:hypothetical protein